MNKNWNNNRIQFPRLLAEIVATGAITNEVMAGLRDGMDLSNDEINEIFDRAQMEWEKIKQSV